MRRIMAGDQEGGGIGGEIDDEVTRASEEPLRSGADAESMSGGDLGRKGAMRSNRERNGETSDSRWVLDGAPGEDGAAIDVTSRLP